MNTLKVGSTYNFYTTRGTILGQKVRVSGILTFDRCSAISYDMYTLAINERVISVRDEDLESRIGTDNIYLLTSINPNTDGTYNEYIVWDSIINYDKTVALDETYKATVSLKIDNSTNFNVQQILQSCVSHIKQVYGNSIDISFSTPTVESNTDTNNELTTVLTKEKLTEVETIIDNLKDFENKLIPAAQQIVSSNISAKISNISDSLSSIKNEISLIKRGL